MRRYTFETKKDKVKAVRAVLEFLVFAAIAVLVVNTLTTNTVYKPYDHKDTSIVTGEDNGFIAVSYFGVDRQGTDTLISTAQLDEQLKSLHDLGYVTISQKDVLDYYKKKKPLPKKALFLMFEDGRRDTALFAQKILEKYNYRATILSYADKFAEQDPKFLSAKDLKDLEATGFWELGTNGYRLSCINAYDRYDRYLGQLTSDEFVNVNQYLGRDYNHYLMDFIRDEDRIPTETESQMDRRITADYDKMEQVYTKELGKVPSLYCIMHSNTGRFGNNDAVSAVNGRNLKGLFSMNFNRDGFAYNNTKSSVYDLTRLQPQASWSTNHLLMRTRDDLPRRKKKSIKFYEGDESVVKRDKGSWKLDKGAVEYKRDRLVLTSPSESEGRMTLRSDACADVEVSAELLGNKVGSQTVYLRADKDNSNCIGVSLENNHLIVFENVDGGRNELFNKDLHDLVPVAERTSVEEDKRDSLAAELGMRGRFADSAGTSALFYAESSKAKAKSAQSVKDGADEYVPEMQINETGDTKLKIALKGDKIDVSVDGKSLTGSLDVSVKKKGAVKVGAAWGGWGYSQRNVADDVYDGVFKDLEVKAGGKTVFDNGLHGFDAVADAISTWFNTVLNWFIVNL